MLRNLFLWVGAVAISLMVQAVTSFRTGGATLYEVKSKYFREGRKEPIYTVPMGLFPPFTCHKGYDREINLTLETQEKGAGWALSRQDECRYHFSRMEHPCAKACIFEAYGIITHPNSPRPELKNIEHLPHYTYGNQDTPQWNVYIGSTHGERDTIAERVRNVLWKRGGEFQTNMIVDRVMKCEEKFTLISNETCEKWNDWYQCVHEAFGDCVPPLSAGKLSGCFESNQESSLMNSKTVKCCEQTRLRCYKYKNRNIFSGREMKFCQPLSSEDEEDLRKCCETMDGKNRYDYPDHDPRRRRVMSKC